MDKLMPGDILHCWNDGIISRLIRKFTRSQISHSAIFIEIWSKPYIIDAQSDGVNVRPFDEWMKKYKYNFLVTRSTQPFLDHKAISIRALSMSGHTAYDFAGLLIKHPIQLITGKYKASKKETEKMYCSEFVAFVYGIENAHRMTPHDLFMYCIEKEFEIINE
jgi:hypothetical protein